MRWAEDVARMGYVINMHNILVGKSEGKNHLEDLGTEGKMISEWIL
jgi:hypothetical protein